MTDLTPTFNALLKEREAPPSGKNYSKDKIDNFLKEAYKISSCISDLHARLRSVRQAYLSTATAPTRSRKQRNKTRSGDGAAPTFMTDWQREELDVQAKRTLRDLNTSIRRLADAEELRRNTEAALLKKKHGGVGGLMGLWASGNGGGGVHESSKSRQLKQAEAAAAQVRAHRESVLWALRQRLQEAGRTQTGMMETRLTREMEKNKSVLAKAGSCAPVLGIGDKLPPSAVAASFFSGQRLPPQEEDNLNVVREEEGLSSDVVQMFEKGNQDILKHYEGTLDLIRTAEQSLVEVSELQSLLVGNLATQSAHIDQLVADSFRIEEDVGGGNRQLQKAAQRPSAAKYTFYAACGLSMFLVLWDAFV